MFKKLASTRALVMLAMLTAIGFALSYLEFPIFPAADFLKLDFSAFTTLFGGYMFGPVGAIIIEGIKQLLIFATHSTTAGVGQLANFIVNSCFALVPSVLYMFKKGRAWVLVGMLIGSVAQIAVSLPVNRYINFPLYMGGGAAAVFAQMWPYILAFNAIKSVVISALVFLLYKRLSFLIKRYVLEPASARKAERQEKSVGGVSPAESGAEESVAPAESEGVAEAGGDKSPQ